VLIAKFNKLLSLNTGVGLGNPDKKKYARRGNPINWQTEQAVLKLLSKASIQYSSLLNSKPSSISFWHQIATNNVIFKTRKLRWLYSLIKYHYHDRRVIRIWWSETYRPRYQSHFRFKRVFARYKKRGFLKIRKWRPFHLWVWSYIYSLTKIGKKGFARLWHSTRRGLAPRWFGGSRAAFCTFWKQLLLRPYTIIYSFKLASSYDTANFLVNSGCCIINGTNATNLFTINLGDIIQFNVTYAKIALKKLFSYTKFRLLRVRKKSNSLSKYFQWKHSINAAVLVFWPLDIDLRYPEYLSKRWVHYALRNLPNANQSAKKFEIPRLYPTKLALKLRKLKRKKSDEEAIK